MRFMMTTTVLHPEAHTFIANLLVESLERPVTAGAFVIDSLQYHFEMPFINAS